MRRSIAVTAAALGAACLLLFPVAQAQGQLDAPLEIYDTSGVGQGIVTTFAVKPSIFDPLAQGGLYYTSSSTSSQGGGRSYTVASQTFPGLFAVGAIGCAGLHGALWAQATYPETDRCRGRQEATLYEPQPINTGQDAFDDAANAVIDHVDFSLTHVRALADHGFSDALVESVEYGLTGADGELVVTVEDFDLQTTSTATPSQVAQRTVVLAKGVRLLGGGISIDTIRSAAQTNSNGTAGAADATLTFTGVTVKVDGKERRATIDNDGVRVTDPALTRKQRIGLNEQIEERLARAGVTIAASSPTEIVEGSTAEASVGGLSIAFSGTLPSVAIPSELAPVLSQVLEQIPTRCLSDFGAPIPLCFGAGVVPGFGSELPLTLQIGSANAFSAASANPLFSVGPDGPTDVFDPAPVAGSQPDAFVPPTTTDQPPVEQPEASEPFVQGGSARGLVARLPAAGLLWGGFLFLVLAVGAGLGPSLRHVGAP